MKKLLALLLAAVMLLTLCACGENKAEDKAEAAPTTSTAPPVLEAPMSVDEVATTLIRAYYLRDYITRFSLMFFDARGQWEDTVTEREGSAEAFFATVQQQADEKGIEADIHSFDDYYTYYHQFILEDVRSIYGEYELSLKVTESTLMTPEELDSFRSNQLGALDPDYVDEDAFNAITEAYVVVVNIVIDGTLKDHSESYRVYVVDHDGRWEVVDHSI